MVARWSASDAGNELLSGSRDRSEPLPIGPGVYRGAERCGPVVAFDRESTHFRIEPVDRGAWAAIARDGGYALCNAGIYDLGGRTVVFDSMLTPTAGEYLAKAAQRLTGRWPDLVVNSHWHGDHVRGNSAFGATPAASTLRTRHLLQTRGRAQWRSDLREMPGALRELEAPTSTIPRRERAMFRGWFRGTLAVARPFALRPPEVTFHRSLTVVGRRRSLRLISYGSGHSPSDVFAVEPESGVVSFGDLLSVGLHPSVTDGDPGRWRRMLGRIRRLGVKRAIPGHGPLGSTREVVQLERYLLSLERRGREIVRRSIPLPEWASERPLPEFRDWRFAPFYVDNLRRAVALAPPGRAQP
jgi:cyclase